MRCQLTYLLFCFFSITCLSQNNGVITVRKPSQKILGKTLNLNDARGVPCGTISFVSESLSKINLKIDYEKNLITDSLFKKSNLNKLYEFSYEIIDDSTLIIKNNNDTYDTCFYRYINQTSNAVCFKSKFFGKLLTGDYAFFYDFDSVIYSESINRVQNVIAFTDSSLTNDSVYKNVKDKKLIQKLNEDYTKRLLDFRERATFNFFRGKYIQEGSRIKLINDLEKEFAELRLQYDSSIIETNLVSTNQLENNNKTLISAYSRYHFGNFKLLYDKAIINYFHPDLYLLKNDKVINIPFQTDTFYCYNLNNYYYTVEKNGNKTQFQKLDEYAVKNINGVGGFYETELWSKNDNRVHFKNLYFTYEKAFEIKDNYALDLEKSYDYILTDSMLAIFINGDTLIDELKNSWHSFSFSYKNQEPYIFGIYHYYDKENELHEFLILFPDYKGVSFTSPVFEYKEAREIFNSRKTNKSSVSFFFFESSDHDIWLTFEDGNYKKFKLFNHHKGLKYKEKHYSLIK